MNIRPFDWRDLPALYRYRSRCVFFHNALLLTRGALHFPGALFSTVAPGIGVSTWIYANEEPAGSLIAQVVHSPGSPLSQLTFIAPGENLESSRLIPLLDSLSASMVDRGAFRLLAEVHEDTRAFEALKSGGFAIYSRQRVWELKQIPAVIGAESAWRPAHEQDLIPVRSLYYNVVPGLVQQVEPFSGGRLNGLVYRKNGEILAYAEIRSGHRGIWLQPLFHPDIGNPPEVLEDLLSSLPFRSLFRQGSFSRPVYLCIRSYLSWLEPLFAKLGAEPGSRQAVMVKHMAIPQKALRPYAIPALEGGRPEASAPIAHFEDTQVVYDSTQNN